MGSESVSMKLVVFALGAAMRLQGQSSDTNHLRLQEFGPPIAKEETRGFLTTVCPNSIVSDPTSHTFYGCRACPRFTSAPDWQNWSIVAIHYGHFTDPATEEAAVATQGCEPHSEKWGGTALFTRDGEKWKLKWYIGGLISNDCLPVHRGDGRDLLVCSDTDGAQGTNWQTLSVADLSRPAGRRETVLLEVTDNTLTCGLEYLEGRDLITPITKAAYRSILFDPVDSKLKVEVDFGTRPFTAEDSKKCLTALGAGQVIPSAFRPHTRTYGLMFDFDGEQFRISADSIKSKHIVEYYAPMHYSSTTKPAGTATSNRR
jgi:hypothetical protein